MGKHVRWLWVAAGLAVGISSIAFTKLVAQEQQPEAGRGMMQGGMGGMMGGGNMRERMQRMMGNRLPPGIAPGLLPEAQSRGARLLQQYCQQCHNLPGPGMHTAREWPQVVDRMNRRMRMMQGMMGVRAPSPAEVRTIVTYLQRHAQVPIHASVYPDLRASAGRTFSRFCAQCHALPDPGQYAAMAWPGVVARMKAHERSMGKRVPTEVQTREIIDFLHQHAR